MDKKNGKLTLSKHGKKRKVSNQSNSSSIPLVIIQTYSSKKQIPKKIFENIKKFAPEFEHLIFDDKDCIGFLHKYYNDNYVKVFHSFPIGAHKADFFRYCYLYKLGGCYLDIKTELICPLYEIIANKNKIITVLSQVSQNSIYQGILCSPPNITIFDNVIQEMIRISENKISHDYLYFTWHFYKVLSIFLNKTNLQIGENKNENKSNNTSSYIFREYCTSNPSDCYDGLDKYGLCCFVLDSENKKTFKTRYSDFGKTW